MPLTAGARLGSYEIVDAPAKAMPGGGGRVFRTKSLARREQGFKKCAIARAGAWQNLRQQGDR